MNLFDQKSNKQYWKKWHEKLFSSKRLGGLQILTHLNEMHPFRDFAKKVKISKSEQHTNAKSLSTPLRNLFYSYGEIRVKDTPLLNRGFRNISLLYFCEFLIRILPNIRYNFEYISFLGCKVKLYIIYFLLLGRKMEL